MAPIVYVTPHVLRRRAVLAGLTWQETLSQRPWRHAPVLELRRALYILFIHSFGIFTGQIFLTLTRFLENISNIVSLNKFIIKINLMIYLIILIISNDTNYVP
jgi:hypothetical protein